MIGYLRRLTIRNLVSPYGLALFSYAVFLFAWTFPPSVYTSYINEPDLVFLDPLTFLFYTSCVVAFLFGVRSCRYLGISTKQVPLARISTRMPIVYLAIPLLLATAFCSIYLILLGAKFNFVALLVSQQGDAIKRAASGGLLTIEGKWIASLMLLTSVLWWAALRIGQIGVKGITKVLLYIFFCFALCVDVLTCIATVDRTNIMSLIAGLLIIYLYRKSRIAGVQLLSLGLSGFVGILSMAATFFLLSFLRGAAVVKLLAMGLLGYTVAPYNHMAALLQGVLRYSYEGRGVYIARYLLTDNKISNVLGLHALFNWPTTLALWESEFPSTASAGLNPAFIWSGVFGYIYSDIGWWTPLLIFSAGIAAAYLWDGFNAGRTIATLLYLWVAFWVLFWLGYNLLLDNRIVTILESGIALSLYDKAFIRRVIGNANGHHEPTSVKGIRSASDARRTGAGDQWHL
jgi:hypothetical protein